MAKEKGKVRRMVIEPADNGGFLSRTERERTPGDKTVGYYEDREEKNVHPSVEHLAAHIQQTFHGKGRGKAPAKKAPPPARGGVASDIGKAMMSMPMKD